MLRTCGLSRAWAFFCAALAVVAVSSVSPSYARPDARVLASAKKCEMKARALLQQLVQIDTGSTTPRADSCGGLISWSAVTRRWPCAADASEKEILAARMTDSQLRRH